MSTMPFRAGTTGAVIRLFFRDAAGALVPVTDPTKYQVLFEREGDTTPTQILDFTVPVQGTVEFVRDFPLRGRYRASGRVTLATPPGSFVSSEYCFTVDRSQFEGWTPPN